MNRKPFSIKIMHRVLATFLMVTLPVTMLTAQQKTEPAVSDLELRQFYIATTLKDSGKGVITFAFLTPGEIEFTANHLFDLFKSGSVTAEGVELQAEYAEARSARQITIPFKLMEDPAGGYHSTNLQIITEEGVELTGEISLYPNTRTTVLVRQRDENVNGRMVAYYGDKSLLAGQMLRSGHEISTPNHGHISIPDRAMEQESDPFIYRNRYWLAGAASVALSGGAAVFLSGGGSSPAMLPAPPGRP